MTILKRIYHFLLYLSNRMEQVVRVIAAVLVFACFCSVFLQVFNRYVMVKQTLIPWTSISWTDELSRFLLIGISYLSLGMCYRRGMLSRADMIYSRLKPAHKKALYLFETLLIGIFIFSACRYGIQFAKVNAIYRSDMLRVPGNLLYLIPVIGGFLVGFEVITELFGVLSGEVPPFESVISPEQERVD